MDRPGANILTSEGGFHLVLLLSSNLYSAVQESNCSKELTQISPTTGYYKLRVILSNSDSTFLLTFSGDPEQRGFNSIEAVIFDESIAEFTPATIQFNGGEKLTKNPSHCAKCHGTNCRPIWDSYPFWPRTFGSASGVFLPDHYPPNYKPGIVELHDAETSMYEKFLKNRKSGRYQYLIGDKSLAELDDSNNSLTLNLVLLRAQQIVFAFEDATVKLPKILNALLFLSSNMGRPDPPKTDITPFLDDKQRTLYEREIGKVTRIVTTKVNEMRRRKLNEMSNTLDIDGPWDDATNIIQCRLDGRR